MSSIAPRAIAADLFDINVEAVERGGLHKCSETMAFTECPSAADISCLAALPGTKAEKRECRKIVINIKFLQNDPSRGTLPAKSQGKA